MHAFHGPYGQYGLTARESFELSAETKRVRRFLEESFIEKGYGPGFHQLMDELGLSQGQLWEALHQLERGVQVMFIPGTENLVKVPPFSYVPTRHKVTVSGRGEWYAGCAGEACGIGGIFPGQEVVVRSLCPDCWQEITICHKDMKLLSVEPATTVMHVGTHPDRFGEDWIRTCDSLNFFISADHAQAWQEAVPDHRGGAMSVEQALEMTANIGKIRYWDYDRGPDVSRGGLDRLRKLGVDTGVWEDA